MKTALRHVVLAGLVSVGMSTPHGLGADVRSPQRDLVVNPPECLEVPPGAEALVLSGTTNNNPPVGSDDPRFPAAACSAITEQWPVVGTVRGYVTSDAALTGTPVGSADMHAEACLVLVPPPTVVAELTITADNGDTLTARIRVPRRPDSPPPPNNEASGTGVVTGGTGRFAGASGEFNINAKSHGTVHPGTNVATFRDIAMCGYISLPEARIRREQRPGPTSTAAGSSD